MKKKKEKLESTVDFLLKKQIENDSGDSHAKENNTVNIEQRVERLVKKADSIKMFLEEQTPKSKTRSGESQSNITDNESAKMKTSHGVIQGYNGLALVDSKHQFVVNAEAFGSGHEHDLLIPMIEGAKKNSEAIGLGADYYKGKRIIADTGSFKEENLEYLSLEKTDAYIPDQQFRKRDPRFLTMNRHKNHADKPYTKDDFIYDKACDRFTCPAGKILKYSVNQKLANTEGRRYISSRSNCNECTLRNKCLCSDKTRYRTLYVVEKYFDRNYSEEMKSKIDTIEGREIYSRRMGIVEPVFGNIRSCKKSKQVYFKDKK